jgi:hypothetical protein
VRDALVLVKDRKLECPSFPPQWNDVVRDALVLVQDEKLTHAIFPPRWNDVRDAFVLLQ